MKKILLGLFLASALILAIAMPAMAVERAVTATATVTEYINFTVIDSSPAGISFGELNPGSSDNREISQNGTTGAVELVVGPETNVNCSIELKGSTDFDDGSGHTIGLANAKYDTDGDVIGAKVMPSFYTSVRSSTAGVETRVKIWHWISIPDNQPSGSYNTSFWYQAVKQR